MPRRRRPPRPGALADLAPMRILTQIVVLQAGFYVSAAILILFTALVAGKEVSLDLLLSWRSLRGDTTVGWTLGLVWMLNSLIWYLTSPLFRNHIPLTYIKQCRLHPPLNRALQTRPRLHANPSLHPPRHHIPLLARPPAALVLVGAAGRLRRAHELPWHLGVSVARAAAD
jgi:hypothetical protein